MEGERLTTVQLNSRWRRCLIIVLATVVSGMAVYAARPRRPAAPDASYVDSRSCGSCHPIQAQSYGLTGMGRSFYIPQPENRIEDYSRNTSYYHAASDTHFRMIERGGKYYQYRYQIGYKGMETNIEEKQIHYVMGSGSHARTYLHRTSRNTLQQLPLGWYAEKSGQWGMSPGYDHPDHPGSRRTITYECMFCHNAYPEIPAANQEYGADSVFKGALPQGIDCQRCHGPAGRHVALAQSGAAKENVRAAIVNPARLSPEREMDVCGQCHLQTTSTALSNSILRYDRGPFSYHAGEPLSAFRLTFDHASGTEDRFEIASSVYRLRQSACFLKSAGRMRCTTCHHPHKTTTADYNSVCRQCHASVSDTRVASERHKLTADCVSCHMPKRRTDDVVHVVMTDHKIQRKGSGRDLIAEKPERLDTKEHAEIVAYDPKLGPSPEDQLYLAIAQVRELGKTNSGIPRLSKLIGQYRPERADYYVELADALVAAKEYAKARPFYDDAARRRPGSPIIQKKLGAVLRETKQFGRAAAVLKRAVNLGSGDASTWHLLGQVYLAQGKTSDAVIAFEKSLALDPDLPEAHNNLGAIFAGSGDAAGAERQFREAMRIQPDLGQARRNVANILALNHDLQQAAYYFESAIRLKPDYATARYDYARILSEVGKTSEAEKQVQAALQTNPNLAEAHELNGILRVSRGDMAGAVRAFREAVRIRPESSHLQLRLGAALVEAGDINNALVHLKLAAQSSDPEVRQAAIDLLKSITIGK